MDGTFQRKNSIVVRVKLELSFTNQFIWHNQSSADRVQHSSKLGKWRVPLETVPNNLPGTLVPRATIVMELTVSFMRVKQPNCAATSPMTAVHTPIAAIDTTKQGQPCILSEQQGF